MAVELPEMWPHQMDFINNIRVALSEHQAVVAHGETGFGKSRVAKWMMASALNSSVSRQQSGKYLFAVRQRGLVDNIRNCLSESPSVPHGVIMSEEDTSWEKRIQVASIDTLLSWFIKGKKYLPNFTFDMIFYDETHSHFAKLHKFLGPHLSARQLQGKNEPYVVGLSATPQARGLGEVFKHIVHGPPPRWLQKHGYASKFRYLSVTKGKMEELIKKNGRYTGDSIDRAMDGLAGDFIRDWLAHASGRPTIGFFPRRSHAYDAMEELNKHGINAEYVDGYTKDEDRRNLYHNLRMGNYEYLCNVGVVERGTDIPNVSCIQLCTAIGSIERYRQMIGRGARISPETNKIDCLILDHAANVQEHGLWEDQISWFLDNHRVAAGEVADRPTMECPECSIVYRGGKCKECGYEPSVKERKAQGLKFDGSKLIEITHVGRKTVTDPDKLWVNSVFAAGKSGRTWRQLCGMFLSKARKAGIKDPKIPRYFIIGGNQYQSLEYNDPDTGMKVRKIYPGLFGKKQ